MFVRTDRIGDVVLITPAIELVKKSLPNAKISVLVSDYTKDIFFGNPHIDEVITVKPISKLAREIRQKKFDAAILFFIEAKSAMACFLAGVPKRIGPASKVWSLLLTRMVFQHRSKTCLEHEADFNIELLKPLGIKPGKTKTKIYVTETQNQKAKKLLKENYDINETDFLVSIHPGSKGSAKNWSPANFAKLANVITEKYPSAKLMLTGSNKEKSLLNEISANVAKKPIVLEPLPLKDFISVLNQSKIVITNSTGPLHIADALGKKTLSFFPVIKGCRYCRWGPYGQGHIVLTPHEEECPKCKTRNGCMDSITVEKSLKAFEELAKNI